MITRISARRHAYACGSLSGSDVATDKADAYPISPVAWKNRVYLVTVGPILNPENGETIYPNDMLLRARDMAVLAANYGFDYIVGKV